MIQPQTPRAGLLAYHMTSHMILPCGVIVGDKSQSYSVLYKFVMGYEVPCEQTNNNMSVSHPQSEGDS